MNIAINGRFLTQPITGVQRYARELVQALDSLLDEYPGVAVTVIAPRFSQPAPRWRHIRLRQAGFLQGHAWEQIELPFLARGALLFCPGNTAPLLSLFAGRRVAVTVHDLSYRYFPEAYSVAFRLWYGVIVPFVLRRADPVITVSEAERAAIIQHYPEAAPRLVAIPNGGLPVGYKAESAARADGRYVLYVGSLSKRKNFPGMIEAARRLAQRRQMQFIFVGGTAGSLARSQADVPGDLKSLISFIGDVESTPQLMSYYHGAACLMFPSFYESSGLPPIEAMACGCPVIASDIPALRERCGEAALYCDPHDIDSITAAVERVIDDATLRARLQTLGYERAGVFSWEACARQTLDAILKTRQR